MLAKFTPPVKKLLSCGLSLLLILSVFHPLFSVVAFAEDVGLPWDGVTREAPTLAEDNFYEIDTAEKLAWFAYEVTTNAKTAINGRLTAHINLGNQPWTPIGNSSRLYIGTFDGQNYKITNLNISTVAVDRGLFGRTAAGAVLKNIYFAAVSLSGARDYTGALAGLAANTVVANCHVEGLRITGANARTGGLFGQISGATLVSDCSVQGTSSMNSIDGSVYVGGLVGILADNGPVFTNCLVEGMSIVARNADSRVAGMIGNAVGRFYMYDSAVVDCYIEGGRFMGGIADMLQNGSVLERNRVVGAEIVSRYTTATGDADIGGLVGAVSGSVINRIQYCYVADTKITVYARMCGGFIGKILGARHIVAESYCAADFDLQGSPIRAGVFIGSAASGETTNAFYRLSSEIPGVAEVSAGVTVQATALEKNDITDGTLLGLLNTTTDIWAEGSGKLPMIDGEKTLAPEQDEDGFYLIRTAYQLEWFEKYVNAGNASASAKLVNDIYLGGKSFSSIGSNTVRYAGVFDGNNFTIQDLILTQLGNERGLFASTAVTSVLRNLKLKNVKITTNGSYAGALVGLSRGQIDNVHVEGVDITSTGSYVGGIAGELQNNSSVTNSSVKGTDFGGYLNGASYVGGAVGNIRTALSEISDISVRGLRIEFTTHGGGIIGDTTGGTASMKDIVSQDNEIAAAYYAGGVMFGLRNGSTLTNATVKNVSVNTTGKNSNGQTWSGGAVGYVDGAAVTVTNAQVDNLTLNCAGGVQVGGIVGFILDSGSAVITDSIIKNSSITASHNIGGVTYHVQGASSYIARTGIVNTEIVATHTGTTSDLYVGGIAGAVSSNAAKAIQYSYVHGVSITCVGRRVGGFVGSVHSGTCNISENYASLVSINNNTAINTGSFVGVRAVVGNLENNFTVNVSDKLEVGSGTVGVAGNTAGITAVTAGQVANGELCDMLNALVHIWQQANDDLENGWPEMGDTAPPAFVNGFYEIQNPYQLEWFRNFVNAGNADANAKLMTSLDLRGKEWIPIGTTAIQYAGTFEGNGNTISNMKITFTGTHKGLFAQTSATSVIRNLNLERVKITATGNYVGALVGLSRGQIDNVHVEGVDITSTASYVGGIVGEMQNNASLTNSSVRASESGANIAGATYVGGAIGNIRATQTGVSNLGVYGLSLQFNTSGGGVIGDTDGGTYITIKDIVSENNNMTSQRYAGGVMFGLRGGSTLTNATVKNVSVSTTSTSGETWSGGVVGYTSGAQVTVTNAQVDNLTLNCLGAQVGGILGFINGNAVITDSIIKNSSITASHYIGGVTYHLQGATSYIARTGIVNTNIVATHTGTTSDLYVGGIAGAVSSSVAKAIQYSYVHGVSITCVGRRVGGFVGSVHSGTCNISENYASLVSINNNTAINTGSFAGVRAVVGNLENNFTVNVSDKLEVGSGTVGVAGNTTGITAVTAGQVANGELCDMLNNIVEIWQQANDDFENGWPEIGNIDPPELVEGYYEIYTAYQFEWFKNFVNAGNADANARLMVNLNLRNKEWVPIGTSALQYAGIFDGNNHTISNLKISFTGTHKGLFAHTSVNSVIRSLKLKNVGITATGNYVGSLVGLGRGQIDNVHVEGVDITSTASYVGGIVGEMQNNASLTNSSVRASESGANIAGATFVGGAIGNIRATQTGVSDIGVYGLGLQFNTYGGGVIGDTDGGTYITIKDIVSENNNMTSQRYAGGVVFGLRGGSTLTDASVKNVSITTTSTSADTFAGGAVGYVDGAVVTLTNVLVDNLTMNCAGSQVGGIFGRISTNAIITDSIIKNSSITALSNVGGVTYYLNGASSYIARTGVVNTNIVATHTGTTTNLNVGGFVGLVASSVEKAIQYSYVHGVEITSVGRATGGFIGQISSGTCNITENYASLVAINNNNATLTGSFVGLRTVGNLENNFTVNVSDKLAVGSATVGVAGNADGITAVTAGQVANGELCEMLNNIVDVWQQANDDLENGWPELGDTAPPELVDDYYEIHTAYHLEWFRAFVNSANPNASARLMANIDLSGKEWAPIGTSAIQYAGTFEGGNFTVSNFKITSAGTHKGLFAQTSINSVIRDLHMKNVSITATGNYVGALVGLSRGQIDNIRVEGVNITSTASYVGGIVGETQNNSSVTNSSVKGTDFGGYVKGAQYVGGAIGNVRATQTEVSNISVTGLIIEASTYVGGVIGDTNGGTASIQDIVSQNNEINAAYYAGGVIFDLRNGSTLANVTVKDVTINTTGKNSDGRTASGGVAGYVDGAQVTITNAQVDNLTLNCVGGVAVGGIVGFIPTTSSVIITDSLIKNSSITASHGIGGVTYELLGATSYIARTGVVNTDIVATNTSTTTNFYVGGIAGAVSSSVAKAIQYSYVHGVNITSVGRATGGFVGSVHSGTCNISENYASLVSINNNNNTLTGSFAGLRNVVGNLENNFTVNVSDKLEVGSGTVGVAGNTAGITAVTAGQVANGELRDMLNNIVEVWKQSNGDFENGWPEIDTPEPPELVDDYYEIKNAYQLEWFRTFVNAGNPNANARLIANINLSEREWAPIGTSATQYAGTFEGGSFTIRDFKITSTGTHKGLFAQTSINSVIRDLKLRNVSITATGNYAGALVGLSRGQIDNVHVEGVDITSTASYVGGIAGELQNNSSVTNSSVKGTDSRGYLKGAQFVGGAIGNVRAAQTEISNISVMGLNIEFSTYGGGVIGDTTGGTSVDMKDITSQNNEINAAYYAGGVMFGLRGGSILTNATVKNVTVNTTGKNSNGQTWSGGVVGYVDGAAVTVTNAQVDNLTLNCVNGVQVGGIVGWIVATSSAVITDSIIKNSSITASHNIGGVTYQLQGATSYIAHTGVVNTDIVATHTGTTTDLYVGGMAGAVSSNVAKAIQYSYVHGVTITSVGRRVGGFVGSVHSGTCNISENYASLVSINNNTAINTGSFVGVRAVAGNLENNFTVNVSDKLEVGSGTVGVAGNTDGITAVTAGQVANGELCDMLNNIMAIWQQANDDFETGWPEIDTPEPPALVEGYYEIHNAYQFEWFRAFVNNGNPSVNARLMEDISMSGKEWIPIGTSAVQYAGTFEGGNFTVSNIKISSAGTHKGLFAHTSINSVIRNLNMDNVVITATGNYVGSLVGLGRGQIDNVHVAGVSITSTASYVGGIVGEMQNNASLTNSSVWASDFGANIAGATYVGGAIGNIRATQTGVSNLGVYGLSLQFNTSGGGVIGDTDGGTVNISNIVSENNEITSQRYAGGVMFGLRNGSTLTNATVKNVSVSTTSTSGETWSGGVVGYTSGARVILTNAQVDNLSLDCVGAQVGGIVGHIAGSAIITESMIKNSTLCADQRIGGVVYYLRGESSINKTAVVNTSITARNTGANTLVYVGGIAGAVNSSEPKAIQYSYVDGVSIYAVGRRTGGLIGTVENAANNISKNYVKDTSIHCSAIETGSFTGLRLGGNLEDNFVVRCSDVPRVGTATAGQTGDIQGVYGVRVYEGDVTELDTGEAIDYYVSNARFVSSFDDVHAAPLKEMFGSVYEESVSFVAVIHAALSQRLEAQIDVLSEIYNRYDMVCLLNYEDIGAWLPGVKTEIAAAIPLSEGLRAKYDFYLDLVAQFNAFLASNGYNSYYELEVGFSTRVVREDDVARYESPRDDFAVDYEKMRNVVDKVDAMLLGGDFATLAGMDLPLQETVQQALAESLYTNENINSVMSEIYPTIVSEMEEAIEENAEFKVLGISISFRGKARSLLDDLMNQFGLAIYPNNLAAKIDTKYAKVRSVLNAAGKNWNAVNFDNPEASNYLDWGEMDKDAFIDALGNSLRGVYGVIRPLLTSNSFDQTKKADFAANVDVKARIVISAVNSYNRAILPLFEMLDVQGFMPSAEFNALSSVDAMMDNILYPVFNWIENELTTAPFSNLVELLPNIAYCLHFGLVESWLKTIKTSIRYDLDGEVDLLFDDATFGIADKTMQLSIYDSLSEEPDDLLYRADLSSFNGLLQVLLKAADINAELPPINNSNLASLGKLVQKDSATTALTRYYISGDSVKVTHMLLEYLFTIMGDEALFGEILAAIEEDETLDEGLSEVFKAIGKSPKDAIAAIVELCNPVEYPLRKLNYGNPLATTQTKVQYSDLWSREHARHITDNLDGYIDNLLNLFGLPAAGELLRETFGELYTNRTLTSVVTGLRDALTDISSSEKILKILNIDISSWQDVEEGHDWGIADGDKDAFLETLCEALSPLNNAIGLFLADRDYTLMDSQITLKGYNGYRHALVPLLEALGCAQDTLLTGDAYLAAVAEDENSMLKHIVRPIFELLERVYEKPAETLFSILPNLLYFVNSGALDTAILNFAQPILVVIDTLRPIYNLEFDLSARDMLSKAMTDALSDLGFILPEGTLAQLEAYAVAATNLHGEEIYVIEANHEDVLTLLLRYLLNFVFHPSNRDALKALLVEQAGIEGQQKQVLETALDTFASMAQNGKGADGILRGIYYVFYGTGIGGEQVTDFLNDFNANWKKVFEMMANSEVEFIRTLGETARNLLNEYFENIFDEGGLASNGLLQFFRSISEFFKRIAAFFSSLFGT